MKKNKLKDGVEVPESRPAATARFSIPKSHAKSISVGDHVHVHLSGKVSGVHEHGYYNNAPDDHVELELKNPKVHKVSGNKADKELRKLMGK